MKPVVLVILDGYGLSEEKKGNAIYLANKPNLDKYFAKYPHQTLEASGVDVGLPEGQMGNSEVGHLNIGAGRIVYQSLTRINKNIKDGLFFSNAEFLKAIEHAKKNNSKLHLMGLFSDGGVHSHLEHFKALVKLAKDNQIDVYVHAFTDGRDTGPMSAVKYVEDFEKYTKEINHGTIATLAGRFYAMDRDNIWERTNEAYQSLTTKKGLKYDSAISALESSYENDIYDEFVTPTVIDENGLIENNDAVIFVNFRPDRAIQISTALTNIKETGVKGKQLENLYFVSMMHYSKTVQGKIAFELQDLKNTYGETISKAGLKQLRIAETQKYAHVTFFFDGGADIEIEGSKRVLIDSPKIKNFAEMPEMSAYEVTEKVLEELDNGYDTVILNYANCDMVAHTGNIEATVKAVEVVDQCLGKVIDKVLALGGISIITSDHGNADKLIEFDKPFTAHTTNPVPIILVSNDYNLRSGGNLGDIAPTMLELLNIKKAPEMTGNSLIVRQ